MHNAQSTIALDTVLSNKENKGKTKGKPKTTNRKTKITNKKEKNQSKKQLIFLINLIIVGLKEAKVAPVLLIE